MHENCAIMSKQFRIDSQKLFHANSKENLGFFVGSCYFVILSYFVKFRETILENEQILYSLVQPTEVGNKQTDRQTREMYTYLSINTKNHQ